MLLVKCSSETQLIIGAKVRLHVHQYVQFTLNGAQLQEKAAGSGAEPCRCAVGVT